MSDGRDVVAGLIDQVNENYEKFIEKLPEAKESMDKILEGFKTIQKKFFLKTQGGTDMATETGSLLKDLFDTLDADADAVKEKFTAFEGPANILITTTSNWVIRMT